MKYIMVTNWRRHWDDVRDNRTFFTESMFRKGMGGDKLKDGTETLFIKRNSDTRKVERCWSGKVYDFKNTLYKDSKAISFRVEIEGEVSCPEKYRDYSEGWYCEEALGKAKPIQKEISEDEAIDKIKAKTGRWWPDIQKEFGESKPSFGKKINFVKDSFKRGIIFRDVEYAYVLLKIGFHKPAVILAEGVIEELLRLYLEHKGVKAQNNTFDEYIKCCKKNGLLKSAIHDLTNAFRQFRNIVHLEKESSKKYSISKSTATGAFASIFTIINDF